VPATLSDRLVTGQPAEAHVLPEATASGQSRREFVGAGLAVAALLALPGCASLRGSKSELDRAIADLHERLGGFQGDAARQAQLAALGLRIENRCREVIALRSDFIQRLDALSRLRDTPSTELGGLIDEYLARRVEWRQELFGVQDELRQALSKAEWDQVVPILNAGSDAFPRSGTARA
jgi:hypothetical protein